MQFRRLRGTIFKITPQGSFSVLYNFDVTHGMFPAAPLVQGSGGRFYGITIFGGTNNVGVVFSITSAGQFSVIYNFDPNGAITAPTDLAWGVDGNIYGTAMDKTLLCPLQQPCYCPTFCGSIFRLTPQGAISGLHNISDLTQGGDPFGIIQGEDGNFYGVAIFGTGPGVIFKITPSGNYSILHDFDLRDGAPVPGGFGAFSQAPSVGSLVEPSPGNFYGLATEGGTGHSDPCTLDVNPGGCGVLFGYGLSN